jgi:hypothetical protein
MTLGERLRQRVGRWLNLLTPRPTVGATAGGERQSSDDFSEKAAAWLAAAEAGRLNPPQDGHDARAWDTYWKNQIEVGAFEQGFSDMMSSDEGLPGLLTRRGARTILCAGNGLSNEALSLAMSGFQVTALDISAVPAELMLRTLRSPEHPLHGLEGFGSIADNTLAFAGSGPIDPGLSPAIHRSADRGPRNGGTLSFVTGDLTNPDVCPGPFDVVIERRTVQLFPDAERIPAFERLVARLAARGVFVSHEHHGGWRPDEPRGHHAEAWLESRGFVLQSEAKGGHGDAAQRLAVLRFSTG